MTTLFGGMFHMSYQPPYPPPPQPQPQPMQPMPPRRRPASVTLAALLMFLIALLALIAAIASLASMNQVVDRFRERAADTDAAQSDINNLVNVIRGASIGTAVLMLLFAVLLLVLALGNLRGSNVSRVFTWIICGLGVLCGCCGLVSVFGQSNVTSFSSGDVNQETAEQLGRALQDSYPGWWLGLSGTLSGLQALGYIAIAVLLALPAANAFFRKPAQPQWQPPPPAM